MEEDWTEARGVGVLVGVRERVGGGVRLPPRNAGGCCMPGLTATWTSARSDTGSSIGSVLTSRLTLSPGRESSEVGVVEIEPSSESMDEVDEVAWRCT